MHCKMQKTMQNATPTNGGYDTKTPIFIGSKIFFRMARRLHYILAWKTKPLLWRIEKWKFKSSTFQIAAVHILTMLRLSMVSATIAASIVKY